MSTHNIQFHNKIRKIPSVFVFLSYRKNSVRTQKWVRISLGKRAIGVRAIEVRLYSKTSMTRTPMSCLPWLVRTRFKSLGNSSDSSRKQKFRDILGFFFLLNHENVCGMYLLESPIEAIPMSTLIIPLFYRRTKKHPCEQHSFVEIDREIYSTVILSLLLIQEEQLSVSGERMRTILMLRELRLPS